MSGRVLNTSLFLILKGKLPVTTALLTQPPETSWSMLGALTKYKNSSKQ